MLAVHAGDANLATIGVLGETTGTVDGFNHRHSSFEGERTGRPHLSAHGNRATQHLNVHREALVHLFLDGEKVANVLGDIGRHLPGHLHLLPHVDSHQPGLRYLDLGRGDLHRGFIHHADHIAHSDAVDAEPAVGARCRGDRCCCRSGWRRSGLSGTRLATAPENGHQQHQRTHPVLTESKHHVDKLAKSIGIRTAAQYLVSLPGFISEVLDSEPTTAISAGLASAFFFLDNFRSPSGLLSSLLE